MTKLERLIIYPLLAVAVFAAAIVFRGGYLLNGARSKSEITFLPMRTWPPIIWSEIGRLRFSLDEKWRAGEVFYRFKVSPLTNELKKARRDIYNLGYPRFFIYLQDADGFSLLGLRIDLIKMQETADGLEYEGHVELALPLYQGINKWTIETSTELYEYLAGRK